MTGSQTAGQASLFDEQSAEGCTDTETTPRVSRERDHVLARLAVAVSELRRHPQPALRLAGELEELAALIVRGAIGELRREGRSWRETGAELGVPFQTLFRRYGSRSEP